MIPESRDVVIYAIQTSKNSIPPKKCYEKTLSMTLAQSYPNIKKRSCYDRANPPLPLPLPNLMLGGTNFSVDNEDVISSMAASGTADGTALAFPFSSIPTKVPPLPATVSTPSSTNFMVGLSTSISALVSFLGSASLFPVAFALDEARCRAMATVAAELRRR